MSAHPLSAAIEALAISLFETRGLAYGLDRRWHALSPSAQGEYQGLAIEILRKLKPEPHVVSHESRSPDGDGHGKVLDSPQGSRTSHRDVTPSRKAVALAGSEPADSLTSPTSDTTTTDYFRLMVDLSCAHTERVRKGIYRDQRPIITPKEQP